MPKLETLTTAKDLFERLSPSQESWRPDPRDWIFRGHSDATFALLPSAWRKSSGGLLLDGRWIDGPCNTVGEQRRAEYQLVKRFFCLADVQGLLLPEDTQTTRDLFREDEMRGEWPPSGLLSLVALAQHYGVPTRLLDWTRKPLVAAYFAALGAAEARLSAGASQPERRLSIWALRRREQGRRPSWLSGVDVVSAPRAGNANLHLQSGMFTLARCRATPDEFPNKRELPTLDTIIGYDDALWQFTLPVSEASALLKLLRDHFVHGGTIYAGYEGVARAVKESRLRLPST